ncbi:MAG: serine hydrolase, partial [Dehalococcoidia bacterium]
MLVSLAGLVTGVPVPELPQPFVAAEPDPALLELIETTLAGFPGTYSVVVHQLADGRYAALNGGQVYYAASLFKLGLLLEVYRQRDAGEVDLGQMLILNEEHVAHDFGTLELLGLQEGDTISLGDAVTAMIVLSDTPTAIMVQDVVGPARVDATLLSLGIERTSFNDRNLPAVAEDIARLLEAIAAGEGVSEESRREMLSLLLQERIGQGVPVPLPEGTAVAHKTGNWTNATHSVAIVWGPAGPYVIVVMSDQPWTWEPIEEVSRAVWDY